MDPNCLLIYRNKSCGTLNILLPSSALKLEFVPKLCCPTQNLVLRSQRCNVLFCRCEKTRTKRNMGRKGLISSHISTSRSTAVRQELEHEVGGRNWGRDQAGILLTGLLSLLSYIAQYHLYRDGNCPWWLGPPTVNMDQENALPYSPRSQSDGGNSSAEVLFSQDTLVCVMLTKANQLTKGLFHRSPNPDDPGSRNKLWSLGTPIWSLHCGECSSGSSVAIRVRSAV